MTALWREGWARTSIRDLEDELGIKAPSIYRRYGSKEALGTAAVDHYVDRVVHRRVGRYLTGEGDPLANIGRFLERSVTQSGDGGRLWGCLLTTTSLDVGAPSTELAAALRRGLEVIEEGLAIEVGRAAEQGLLRAGIDPEEAVATLTLVMQGLMALARTSTDTADLRRRARAAVATISGGSG